MLLYEQLKSMIRWQGSVTSRQHLYFCTVPSETIAATATSPTIDAEGETTNENT